MITYKSECLNRSQEIHLTGKTFIPTNYLANKRNKEKDRNAIQKIHDQVILPTPPLSSWKGGIHTQLADDLVMLKTGKRFFTNIMQLIKCRDIR